MVIPSTALELPRRVLRDAQEATGVAGAVQPCIRAGLVSVQYIELAPDMFLQF